MKKTDEKSVFAPRMIRIESSILTKFCAVSHVQTSINFRKRRRHKKAENVIRVERAIGLNWVKYFCATRYPSRMVGADFQNTHSTKNALKTFIRALFRWQVALSEETNIDTITYGLHRSIEHRNHILFIT